MASPKSARATRTATASTATASKPPIRNHPRLGAVAPEAWRPDDGTIYGTCDVDRDRVRHDLVRRRTGCI